MCILLTTNIMNLGVRVRRNNQANTERTLDLFTHGQQTS